MAVDYARFVRAQDRVWESVVAELTLGRKQSHWMWFVFPQLRGLGRSETSIFYGIETAADARDYASHPIAGERLETATRLVLRHAGTPPETIFGAVDAVKLRSSMTLFEATPQMSSDAATLLDTFFDGARCPLTLDRIAQPA